MKDSIVTPLLGGKVVDVVPTKETVDYDRIYYFTKDPHFGRFRADRALKKGHVREIKKQIEEGKYKSKYIAPVRVDINTLKTTDGKHRYEAFKLAWEFGSTEPMRVMFEDLPEDEREALDVMVAVNANQETWKTLDYEDRLKKEENKAMINIVGFALTHPLCCKTKKNGEQKPYSRYTYAFLFGRNITKDVKKGQVCLTKEQINFAEKIYKEVKALVEALRYEMNNWFESFVQAWYDIRLNDRANSALIDELGIDVISRNIFKQFDGWHPVSQKSVWENRLRTALWEIKRGIETKTIAV